MAPEISSPAVEAIVNRWIVDYYISLAVSLFENKQYDDVGALREVLDSVLARSVEPTDLLLVKIKVFDFLCHINDSENLDPESNQSKTSLESALMLLESMNQECSIPQKDFNNVCTSLKEMMVGMLIKNNMFDKAKEMLIKHFPKAMVTKKALFMRLINKRSKMHEVIEQIDFQRFREEMFAFCRSVCTFDVPFLHKAAMALIDRKYVVQDNVSSGSDEEEAGPSSNPQMSTGQMETREPTIIQKTRLAAAYKALAVDPAERTFAQLEEEVEGEERTRTMELSLQKSPTPEKETNGDSEQDELFQRDSDSPMEASPADHPTQTDAVTQKQVGSLSKTPPVQNKRRLFTLARLVMEPDSQGSLQESDVTPEEPPRSPAINNKKDPQNQETDTRVSTISTRASTRSTESSPDVGEGSSSSGVDKKTSLGKRFYQSNISFSGKSKRLSSGGVEAKAPCKTPVKEPLKQLASVSQSKDLLDNSILDSSLDRSDEMFPHTSSTPHKDSAQGQSPSRSKWKQLYNTAKETKDVWSDEDTYFNTKKKSHNESTELRGKRKGWSDSETKKLKEGVKRFGEGNWSKIQAYYLPDRTNVNLKDRWRTMKKLNLA